MTSLEKIEVFYNRNKGFKKIEDLEKSLSQEAFDMVKAHALCMEKDARLRDVTHKLIIRIVLVISLIVFIILIVLANLLSALICFSILLALSYFLAILQARKIKKLTTEYELKIAGSDWDYFGCRIENRFGLRSWKFYAWVPFIAPTISIIVHVLRKPEQKRISARDIDNGLVIGKLSGASKPSTSQPVQIPGTVESQGQTAHPRKKLSIPVRGKLGPLAPLNLNERRYKEDSDGSIDLGNHNEPLDNGKKMENEKLFG